MFRSRFVAAAAAFVVGCSFSTPSRIAQAQQAGDLILSAIGLKAGLYACDFASQSMTTLATEPTHAVRTHGDVILYTPVASSLTRLRAIGGAHPLWGTLPTGVDGAGIEVDQDGNALVAGSDKRLYRLAPGVFSVVKTFAIGLNAVARDLETGDFIVASRNDGRVFRSDRSQTTYSTAHNFGSVSSSALGSMPGGYVAVASRQPNGLYLGDLAGNGAQLPVPHINALAVDHVGDVVWAANTAGEVYKLVGGVVVDVKNFGSFAFTGMDVFGRDKIRVEKAEASRTVKLRLAFPQSASRGYCVALSFGMRPGIGFSQNRRVNLQADDLFFLTACKNIPTLTKDFVGLLDASGHGTAEVTIPAGLPPVTFYASAVATNPAFPDGLELAGTVVIEG